MTETDLRVPPEAARPRPEGPGAPEAAARRRAAGGVLSGTGAMVCVGGSVAVSGVLAGGPLLTAEAVRYAAACLLLVVMARITGRSLAMPRGAEWLWLSGIAATGLLIAAVVAAGKSSSSASTSPTPTTTSPPHSTDRAR